MRSSSRRVLVIGSGAREHALARALSRSPSVAEVVVAPGNAGTVSEGAPGLAPIRRRALPGGLAVPALVPEIDRQPEHAHGRQRDQVGLDEIGNDMLHAASRPAAVEIVSADAG